MKNIKTNEWRNYPIVFFSGLIAIYTAYEAISALFNL